MTGPIRVKGVCPLDCQDSCAWTVEVAAGQVVRVEGDRDHPVTRGVLCAKLRDYERRLTAVDRLLTPLRRSGPKRAGQFQRIGWDAALAEIAGRFRDIIASHGAEALPLTPISNRSRAVMASSTAARSSKWPPK